MKKSLLILSILMMCLIYMPSEIYAEDVLIETNKCSDESEDLIYSAYDTDNDNIVDKLVISGTGAFTKLDYQYNGINTVIFEEGVTSIDTYIYCKELYVPKSVTQIVSSFGYMLILTFQDMRYMIPKQDSGTGLMVKIREQLRNQETYTLGHIQEIGEMSI